MKIGLVLLSGGMDSTALLHQSLHRNTETHALFCAYGQASQFVERAVCESLCARRRVTLHVASLDGAVQGVPGKPPPAGVHRGINTANMPARNMVMIAAATSVAGQLWGDPTAWCEGSGHSVAILLGATFDDVKNFPDCRESFELAVSAAAAEALYGIVKCTVDFPWRKIPKWDLLRLMASKWPDAMADIESSVSCYSGTNCGECSACVMRDRAFRRFNRPPPSAEGQPEDKVRL